MTVSIIILSLTLLFPLLSALTATLTLEQYEPLLLTLRFSRPVPLPAFQLLYNNIYSIPYTIQTAEPVSNSFVIEGNLTDIEEEADYSLQIYNLLFNSPLSIGDGSLPLGCYRLKAAKIPVLISFPATVGILLLIGAYFFNLFT